MSVCMCVWISLSAHFMQLIFENKRGEEAGAGWFDDEKKTSSRLF